MKRLLPFLTLLLALGCSHVVLKRGDGAPADGEKVRRDVNAFLWGFVPGTKLPPESEICPRSRIEAIDLKMESSQVLISIITVGIYVPHRVEFTCARAATDPDS